MGNIGEWPEFCSKTNAMTKVRPNLWLVEHPVEFLLGLPHSAGATTPSMAARTNLVKSYNTIQTV